MPKKFSSLFFRPTLMGACILSLSGISHGQAVPAAKQRTVTINGQNYLLTSKLKKILVGSFYYNYNHTQGTLNTDSTLTRLGRAEGWTVDISTNGADITASKLAGYQVFFANYISSWASATGFPTANRTAVQNFVETQGGGVLIMHSSGDSRVGGNWPWFYSTAHPVNYIGESARTTVSAPMYVPPPMRAANRADHADHPIVEGVGFGTNGTSDTFTVSQGEFHQFSHYITSVVPNADLLISMNGALCKNNNTGTNCGVSTSTYVYGPPGTPAVPGPYPAAWTYPDMKGNIGYFMEGHDLITMQAMGQANWDKFFKQFMYWMAGYDTVLVGSGVHKSDLNFSLDASGVTFHPTEVGVLISKPGLHSVALYDMQGRTIKQARGKGPMDYNWNSELKGFNGIYVMRVAVSGRVMSRRFLVR